MSGGWENAGVKKIERIFSDFFSRRSVRLRWAAASCWKKTLSFSAFDADWYEEKDRSGSERVDFFLKKIFNLKNEKLRFWSTRVLHVVAWSWLRGRCQAPRNVDFRKINKNQTRATLAKFGWCAVVFVEHFYFYYFHTLSDFFTVKLLIIFFYFGRFLRW